MTHLGATINSNGKIELRGPYTAALMEFYHSLPSARWSKSKLDRKSVV